MKINLEAIWKELGLPLGLTLFLASILGLLGLSLDQVIDVAGSLVGLAALIGLALNVLKWAGVLPDGIAGKVSAVLNLAVLIGVASVLKFFPAFDFSSVDAQAAEFARVAAIVFAYIVQIVSSKSAHKLLINGFGIRVFSYTAK